MVPELAQRAGLPMPRVYLIDEDAPNAFRHRTQPPSMRTVAATTASGAPSSANWRGVMAHELAHVKHRDIPPVSTVSDDGRRDLDARQLRDVLRRPRQSGALTQS